MSALPLLEAVRRAGGTIALQGDRLRLSAPEPLPQKLLEEVRLHKADLIDQLRCAAPPLLGEPPADPPRPGRASPTGTIATWADGVARLREMPPPRNYPGHAWQQLIVDAKRFLDGWSQQAVALGWPDWELFGCHKRAPWGRIQGMGLVLLLRGDQIAALTATEALIRTRTGARQTYRRKLADPLHPAERCLVWELAGEC
jgi:hypothetical protein